MTLTDKLLKGLVWIIGMSGLVLGVFFAGLVYQGYVLLHQHDQVIMYGIGVFLGVITFFGTLIGMVLLAEQIDKPLKTGLFPTQSQDGNQEKTN